MSPNKYIKIQPQCEKCGQLCDLLVHHIDENRENNSASNLMVLCTSCHAIIHDRIKNITKMRRYYMTDMKQLTFKF